MEQVNYIPTSQSGFGIVCTLILGWYSDWNPRTHRAHVSVLLTFTAIICGAVMLNPPNHAAKFAALILNGAQFAGQVRGPFPFPILPPLLFNLEEMNDLIG